MGFPAFPGSRMSSIVFTKVRHCLYLELVHSSLHPPRPYHMNRRYYVLQSHLLAQMSDCFIGVPPFSNTAASIFCYVLVQFDQFRC
jgi:hypothetical protein